MKITKSVKEFFDYLYLKMGSFYGLRKTLVLDVICHPRDEERVAEYLKPRFDDPIIYFWLDIEKEEPQILYRTTINEDLTVTVCAVLITICVFLLAGSILTEIM